MAGANGSERQGTLAPPSATALRDTTALSAIAADEGGAVWLLHGVAAACNEAKTLPQALQSALREVCLHYDIPVAHAWYHRRAGHGGATGEHLWHVTDHHRFGPLARSSLPGPAASGLGRRAAVGRAAAWQHELDAEPVVPGGPNLASYGLRSGFALPVLDKGEPVAVLEFFSSRYLEPDDTRKWSLTVVSRHLGRVAERARATAELAATVEALDPTGVPAALNRDVMRFVGTVVHAMRQPLTILSGFAKTLLDREDELDGNIRRICLAAIDEQAARMATLADDLLLLAHAEADGEADEQRVEVAGAVGRVVAGAGLDVEVTCDDGLAVWADPLHLDRILRNLLANAVVHGTDPVTVAAERTESGVSLQVCDSGPGVAPDLVPSLFETFVPQRTDPGRRSGAGLGLPTVAVLARVNGGRVDYERKPDGGSCFVVTLPLVMDA
ncbi:MAG TPA: HAMP domain-containing sensor histidine kinase [Acidimicrobiales bacterium]|nr:HAMP domain-containing sensor histidine kinase [Acidimicrobiales bacterium]